VIFETWKVEQGQLVRRAHQPDRSRILDANAELRKNPEALRDLSFMGDRLAIPKLDYLRLQRIMPELNAKDAATRTAAWKKFYASSAADPYRVKHRNRARG